MASISIEKLFYSCSPKLFHSTLDRICASDAGSRLVKGMFWSLAGAILSRGLTLCSMIIIARLLGRDVFGELGMIQSTVGMFGVFAGFGLGLTATKHVAEYRQSQPVRAARIIGLSSLFATVTGGLMAIGMYVAAPWLAEYTINAPHLTGVLRIGAVMLFFSAINGSQTGALSGFEAFKTIAVVNFWVGMLSFPVLVGGVYFGGIHGAVWALSINLCIGWLLNHFALRSVAKNHNVPLIFKGCFQERSVLWRFSLPAAMSGFLVGPVNWACGALLVNQVGGYGEMGLYSVGNQWRVAILFVPTMLSKVVLPLLSNLDAEKSSEKFRKVLLLNISINLLISVCAVIPFWFGTSLILDVYGAGFEKGVWPFRFLLVSSVFIAVNEVIGQAISSKGKMWVGFTFNALWAFSFLAVAAFLILKGYGALGLAGAALIAYFLHSIWQGAYLTVLLRRDL